MFLNADITHLYPQSCRRIYSNVKVQISLKLFKFQYIATFMWANAKANSRGP